MESETTKKMAKRVLDNQGSVPLATLHAIEEMGSVANDFFTKLKGPKGDKGEQGEKGDKGDQGESLTWDMLSDEQKASLKGEKGEDGKDGVDGVDGTDGKDGRDGVDGKDGSPDTGEQIVEKINGLGKKAPKIDASHIANLPEMTQTVVREMTLGQVETPLKAGTGVTISKDSTGANVISATASGSGDVSKVGTPVNNQVGVWTGDGTIEGDADLTFDTTTNTLSTGALNLSGLTASQIVATDGSKNLQSLAVATYPSLTELSYVKGATSAIQTQLGTKAASGANTDITSVYLNNTGLKVKDTNASHGLTIKVGSDLTADKTLTVTTGDADRTLTLSGDATISGTSSGTNTGDQTSIVGITGTKAQFNTAVTDGDFLFSGDVTQYTDELAQDAVGTILTDTATIDFTYTDATPSITADVKDASITYAKIQIVSATDKVLGRTSVGAGSVEEISTTGSGNVVRATSPTLVTPALGTPSALTLTNATGLPLTGLVSDTTTALGVGSIELGHATDTTITRVSAGVIAVEGTNLVKAGAATSSGLTMATSRVLGRTTAATGAIEELSSVDTFVSSANDTTAGKVELATAAETTTGTDATRAVTPDGLAGSTVFGRKTVSIQVTDGTTDVATGDGKAYLTIPEALNGMNLVRAQATVVTAGTTNATTVMIHNKTDAVDMLSGAISIASGGTVGTVGTVNGAADDVSTNDILRIDVDSVSTTAPKGLMVVLEFQLP